MPMQVQTPVREPINYRQGRNPEPSDPGIDRTPKLFIEGKQARPDSGYSYPVFNDGNKWDRRPRKPKRYSKCSEAPMARS